MNNAINTTSSLNSLSEQPIMTIKSRLQKARQVWRISETLARVLVWFGAALGIALALGVLDNLFDLSGALRLLLGLAVVFGGLAMLLAWVLQPLFWRINDQAAAVYFERKSGNRENLLINAVQLEARLSQNKLNKKDGMSVSSSMIEFIISRAATRAMELSTDLIWDRKRLRKLSIAALAALVLMTIYICATPSYSRHAFQRYASPLSDLPPMSRVRALIFPVGDKDVLAGDSLVVHGVACAEKGDLPSEAFIVAQIEGSTRRIPMNSAPAPCAELAEQVAKNEKSVAFSYELSRLVKSFSFYICAGDGRSLPCKITLRERPSIGELNLELTPPAYTGLAFARQSLPSGLIHALIGSQAALIFTVTKPIVSGALELPDCRAKIKQREDGSWQSNFTIAQEGSYTLSLKAVDGVETKNALEGRILPQSDSLPIVAFDVPALNISVAPGATIALAVKAQDDFGLKYLRLLARKQPTGGEIVEEKASDFAIIKEWKHSIPGPKNENELYPLRLEPSQYAAGETFTLYAEACDHCPNGNRAARSTPLVIHLLTFEQMAPNADSPLATTFKRIQELINLEIKARAKTISIREFIEDVLRQNLLVKRLDSARASQSEVNSAAQRLLADLEKLRKEKGKEIAAEILNGLKVIVASPMTQALNAISEIQAAQKERAKLTTLLQNEETLQTEIINQLITLLGNVAAIAKETQKTDTGEVLSDDQENHRLREKLEDAKDKIEQFIAAQKKVIDSTEELEKKKPLDLTEKDKQKLGDLAKEEQEWAKYFREKFTDLSKIADQDFSNSKLANEFNEVYQEIQKAADALAAKNMETAVRNEESGLELAKELQTNIEKWLPDTRDNIKWNMEEPQGQFDVPLADLPEELEDIIGELVDKEEDMTDDVEDVSSSWLDSLDKGAGWDASDGPISDMSAKGITGNRLPNQQEVGGRSGEGRSGKSVGQFVENTADGKGGRQTPSRVTNDPYESGQVDDKSKDPIGGATGGGKSSGAASGGLRGAPPPAVAQKMERLKETQTQLRQQAEKVITKLHAYHLPASDMEDAARRMDAIEKRLETGQGFNLRQAHSNVLDNLKKEKQALGLQAKINRELSRDLSERVRHSILSGMTQKAPAGYQDLLEAYYKSLVEKKE